jgi:putative membrane protein
MKRFLVRVIINALALWLTTVIVGAFSSNSGITIFPSPEGDVVGYILRLLLIALIFGIVNGIIGNFIRIVAFPLYILTLGLIALVVNSLLLLLVSWISDQIGFGLHIENFWWGVLGAVVLGIISWILSIVLRPIVGKKNVKR